MLILGIETSCDETAAALVENGTKCISSSLATSLELHQKTGGVVPEVAARKQVEYITPVIAKTLEKAGITPNEAVQKIDAIAVTVGPGLIGSLLVGVEAAKALAFAWQKPLIPVNHLVGHIYGNFVAVDGFTPTEVVFPAVVLIVSGGHTDLVLMHNHGNLQYLGWTLDDAAGEAFDKTARLLGITDYPGGPALSKLAATCSKNLLAGKLPRPKMHDHDFNFSFSGLKTAVRVLVESGTVPTNQIACEFETAVIDVLEKKTFAAAKKFNAGSVLLGGGVSANLPLRTRIKTRAEKEGIALHVPPPALCTDNAIYIASAAFFNYTKADLGKVKADPSLRIVAA